MTNTAHVVYTVPPPGLVWNCGCLPAPSQENALVHVSAPPALSVVCLELFTSLVWCVGAAGLIIRNA